MARSARCGRELRGAARAAFRNYSSSQGARRPCIRSPRYQRAFAPGRLWRPCEDCRAECPLDAAGADRRSCRREWERSPAAWPLRRVRDWRRRRDDSSSTSISRCRLEQMAGAKTSPGDRPQCTASCSIRPATHQKRNSKMHSKYSRTFVLAMAAGSVLILGCTQSDSGSNAVDTAAPPADSVVTAPPVAPTPATADMRIEVDVKARQLHVLKGGQRTATHSVAVGSEKWPTRTGEWNITQVVWN